MLCIVGTIHDDSKEWSAFAQILPISASDHFKGRQKDSEREAITEVKSDFSCTITGIKSFESFRLDADSKWPPAAALVGPHICDQDILANSCRCQLSVNKIMVAIQ